MILPEILKYHAQYIYSTKHKVLGKKSDQMELLKTHSHLDIKTSFTFSLTFIDSWEH